MSRSRYQLSACYPNSIRTITGNMLAGVSNSVAAPGSLYDACIEVTTAMGRTEVLRVVTFTESSGFGGGPFTLRVTGVTGASIDIALDGVEPGALVAAEGNIPLD